LQRQASCLPGSKAAIEHRYPLVPQPAQQPPQPRRERGFVLVIGHDIRIGIDPRGAEERSEGRGVRQRMPPGLRCHRPRQVMIEVGKHRAGNVGRRKFLPSPVRAWQIVPAIENDSACFGPRESSGKFGRFNQVQWQFLYNHADSLVNQVYGD
jgi:hypothetical protein